MHQQYSVINMSRRIFFLVPLPGRLLEYNKNNDEGFKNINQDGDYYDYYCDYYTFDHHFYPLSLRKFILKCILWETGLYPEKKFIICDKLPRKLTVSAVSAANLFFFFERVIHVKKSFVASFNGLFQSHMSRTLDLKKKSLCVKRSLAVSLLLPN